MKAVKISDFRREMGKYMNQIRRGKTVVLADRDRPLAELIPYRSRREGRLSIRRAEGDFFEIAQRLLGARGAGETDSSAVLREDRDTR